MRREDHGRRRAKGARLEEAEARTRERHRVHLSGVTHPARTARAKGCGAETEGSYTLIVTTAAISVRVTIVLSPSSNHLQHVCVTTELTWGFGDKGEGRMLK